jgi:beta-lactamase class A
MRAVFNTADRVSAYNLRMLIFSASLLLAQVAICDPSAIQRWPHLADVYDDHLQEGLQAIIASSGLEEAVDGKRLAIALADVTNPQNPRLAGVNEHEMMYAASLPKIAIMLAAYQKAEDTGEALSQETENLLISMIRDSSNAAATQMIDRVGFDYIARVLTSDRYKLYDEDDDGGLWIGKAYASEGAWRRDPLNNLSHAASAFEVARFYYLLATDRLVSPEASAAMKTILSDPGITHKFVKGLKEQRPGSRIFRKSGTWRTYHSDSALVERDGRTYIAVALCNDRSCGAWLKDLIVELDNLIFEAENVAQDGR